MPNQFFLNEGIPTVRINDPLELSNFTLIDVRSEEEFFGELSHIEKARLVTLGPELEVYLQSVEKNEKIIFICRSGIRSARATRLALDTGIKNVFNMEGGMIEWNEKKFPVVSLKNESL